METDNPFERYGLDPREGITAITQRLKELAEDARTDAEREEIREAWEELTLHPARRLRAALFAHPETRSPLGAPPLRPRARQHVDPTPPSLHEVAARPSVLLASESASVEARAPARTALISSLEDDPVLRGLG